MFDVIFQNDYNGQYSVVASGLKTVAEAKAHRQVSGDIVVFHKTTNIVRNKTWMWKCEVDDPNSYVMRRIKGPDVKTMTGKPFTSDR